MNTEPNVLGHYEGVPVVELLREGRNVKLLRDLIFVDSKNTRWAVPALAVVDGASIPQPFWSIVGAPLDGNYRDASIIHDWFCDKRTRTWQATHRVFYEAMLVSGVSKIKAKTMYFAVYWRGPRWEPRVSHNTNLNVGDNYNFSPGTVDDVPSPGDNSSPQRQLEIMIAAKELIELNDYSINDINELSDKYDR